MKKLIVDTLIRWASSLKRNQPLKRSQCLKKLDRASMSFKDRRVYDKKFLLGHICRELQIKELNNIIRNMY